MDDNIDAALQTIEDDYKICLRIIGRYFDYLETCGLKEFNKYSKYKWSYDRDRSKGGSYVCIRYGNSLIKKCLVKKRAYIENDDLYKWAGNKNLVQEALDEAYQYIVTKISGVRGRLDDMKKTAEEYAEKLEKIPGDDSEEDETASKKISWEEAVDSESSAGKKRHL
jgi:hypothetical protein